MKNATDNILDQLLEVATERRACRDAGARAQSRLEAELDGGAEAGRAWKRELQRLQRECGWWTREQARRIRPFRKELKRLGLEVDEALLRQAAWSAASTSYADLRKMVGLPPVPDFAEARRIGEAALAAC